jgi:hypothetical protein
MRNRAVDLRVDTAAVFQTAAEAVYTVRIV